MVIAGCILLLAGLAGYLLPEPSEAVPSRILMENSGGRVVFTHQAHSTPGGAYGDSDCAVCHHELQVAPTGVKDPPTPDVLACKSCHGVTEQPDFIEKHQEFYRANGGDDACIRCHHTQVKGFSKDWNHKDHWEYVGDCTVCHHEPRIKNKSGRTMNVKPQRCRNCHTAAPNPMTDKTIRDAGHIRCESCHSEFFEAGAKGCKTCHKALPAEASLAQARAASPPAGLDKAFLVSCTACHTALPGGMDAFHGQCITCHEKAERGPGGKSCQQCHTP